jgi:hypothetical protein
MYVDYLRTGDAAEMERVVYHNALDILSLVSLTGEILKRHRPDGLSGLSGSEALGVARWQEERGRPTTAERAFRAALQADKLQARIDALRHFSAYLKRENRRAEAVPLWTEWHELAQEDPTPCIELAMFYEWHEPDIKKACAWTESALVCLSHWHSSWRRDQVWGAIEHRLRRLNRKLDQT